MVSQRVFKNLLNYIMIFIVFSDALVLNTTYLFEVRFSYLIMILFLILFLPYTRKIYFSKTFLVFFAIVIGCSMLNIYLGNASALLLFKQIVGISMSAVVFYLLIKFNHEDIKRLFQIYLNIAFIIGIIGIIQEIGYILHIQSLFDYRFIFSKMLLPNVLYTEPFLRINAILPEPASFCIAMMPAFSVALFSLLRHNFDLINRLKCFIIIIAFLLSFSSIGYLGIFFTIILFIFNTAKKERIIAYSVVTIFVSAVCFLNINSLKMRAGDTFNILIRQKKLSETNLSTFTLGNNAVVTYNVLKKSPVFGYGLGSHELSYDKHIQKSMFPNTWFPLLNKKDANSLLLRILSEAGIFGLLIFLGFLFKFYIPKSKDKADYLWVINNSILVFFILRLIRQGNYISEGFFFFFWLYYFTKKVLTNSKLNEDSY